MVVPFFLQNSPSVNQFPEVLDSWNAQYGVTSSGERVSSWLGTKIGTDLAQASGAAQPILLPYAGVNYFWGSGAAGSGATSPDAAVSRPIGDMAIVARVAANGWTSGAGYILFNGNQGSNSLTNFYLYLNADGTLLFSRPTGATARAFTSSVAVGVANFTAKYIGVAFDQDNGGQSEVKFYLSDDGVVFTQLGTTRSNANTGDGNSVSAYNITIGADQTLGNNFSGKIYSEAIYNGIPPILGGSGSASPVFFPNFTAVPEGATSFTESSSNAATVTINSTGSKPAQIVGSQQLLFDGAAFFLQTANFTLNQPCSMYAVMQVNAYTAGTEVLLGGKQTDTAWAYSPSGGSDVAVYAGATGGQAAGPAAGAYRVIRGVLNGASSGWSVDLDALNAGNAGAANPGGVTVGANFSGGGGFSRMSCKALALCPSVLSAARAEQLIRAMAAQGGVAL